MSVIDLIKGRKNILYQESDGITLATHTINEFEDRTFTFKGLKNRYFELSGEDLFKLIQEEMENMLIMYSYTTKIKTYIDRKGIGQAEIKLLGQASTMGRYNPLNVELYIKTEPQINYFKNCHVFGDNVIAKFIRPDYKRMVLQ